MHNLINIKAKSNFKGRCRFISNISEPIPLKLINLDISSCIDCASVPPAVPWDGGTIYNIGNLVTFNGKTWRCLHYAVAGAGPFGGYLDGTAPGHEGIIYWEQAI